MVANKDMKMPKSCYSCREQATCYWALSNGWIQDKRDDNCPLIEIEQSEDCVSRKQLLEKTVKKNGIWNKITNSKGENLEEIITKLPTVTPTHGTCKNCSRNGTMRCKCFMSDGHEYMSYKNPDFYCKDFEGE